MTGKLLYFPEMPQERPEELPTASDLSPAVPEPYKPTWTFPEGFLEGTQRLADMLKE